MGAKEAMKIPRLQTDLTFPEWLEYYGKGKYSVYTLEGDQDGTGIFMTKERIEDGNWYYISLEFWLWINGELIEVSKDYHRLYRAKDRIMEHRRNNEREPVSVVGGEFPEGPDAYHA